MIFNKIQHEILLQSRLFGIFCKHTLIILQIFNFLKVAPSLKPRHVITYVLRGKYVVMVGLHSTDYILRLFRQFLNVILHGKSFFLHFLHEAYLYFTDEMVELLLYSTKTPKEFY